MKNKSTWLSAHIYYAEPWTNLLTLCIKPFVDAALRKKEISSYFFIRYWEEGPHIRLRLHGEISKLNDEVKHALERHVTNYIQLNPSTRRTYTEPLAANAPMQPNNTFRYVPYHQEVNRYGGTEAIYIAEKHFMYSSAAILDALSKATEWDYATALGTAIQMHFSFAFSAGMSLYDTALFFNAVYETWLPRAYRSMYEPEVAEDLKSLRVKTIHAFEAMFMKQEHILMPSCKTLWQALQAGEEFEEEWINLWIRNNKEVIHSLSAVQSEKRLQLPVESDSYTSLPDLWSIYDSYIHMTNNRLGILNRDESYLAYLLKTCSRQMINEEVNSQHVKE